MWGTGGYDPYDATGPAVSGAVTFPRTGTDSRRSGPKGNRLVLIPGSALSGNKGLSSRRDEIEIERCDMDTLGSFSDLLNVFFEH